MSDFPPRSSLPENTRVIADDGVRGTVGCWVSDETIRVLLDMGNTVNMDPRKLRAIE